MPTKRNEGLWVHERTQIKRTNERQKSNDNKRNGIGDIMLPEKCKSCTHYADKVCCHPDPFPGIMEILNGENCESFEQNYDME